MPELPEVEVIRCGLDEVLPGRLIEGIEVLEARSFIGFNQDLVHLLVGMQVRKVQRRGKMLMIYLGTSISAVIPEEESKNKASSAGSRQLPPPDGSAELGSTDSVQTSNSAVLLVHLRMTGQLIYRKAESEDDKALSGGFPNASLIGELPDKSTRIIITLDNQDKLYFNDQRKFGYFKLVAEDRLSEDGFLAHLGPEPLADGFTWQDLRKALGSGSISVKGALLDQQRLAGIGNIYADESLFRASIDPRRSVSTLTPNNYKRLLASIIECLTLSIDAGGSTARNYVDAMGLRGEFLDLYAAVYGKDGQACPRCGHPIEKIRVASRGTHICPKCQK